MNLIKKGSTDVTRYIMLVDSAAGTPETGYTITDLDLQYTRNRTAPATKVDATALAATDSAHSDNKAIQVDATSSPGLYRIDWPDAAFATGVDKVILVVSGAGLHPAVEEIQLVDFDPADGVRLGLTALPNAAADAPGGLPISDAGGLDLDAKIGALTFTVANKVDANVTHFGGTAGTFSGGRPEVNASHISGDSVAADTLELFAEALDQATGQIDNGTFAAGAIDAAAIANGAIDAATFAADVDAEILSYLVDDATRIDASALNTASTAVGSNGSGLTEAGGTGDHLTAVPWNAAWDAEVQSEVDDALVANNLDHLCKTATAAADMTTEVADNTIVARILANGDTSAFDPSTDGLQLIRDKLTDIETDTQDIQSRLPAALTAGGNMKADALAISGDAIAADTLELFVEALDQATGQLDNGSFQTNAFTGTMFATSFYDDIYAQVQAVLEEIPVTDFTAIPVSTPTYSQALGFLYALGLNRHTCTATTATIYDSDNNAVGVATVSDDGTTFTRTKYS